MGAAVLVVAGARVVPGIDAMPKTWVNVQATTFESDQVIGKPKNHNQVRL